MKKYLKLMLISAILSSMILTLSACGEKEEEHKEDILNNEMPEKIEEEVEDIKVKVKSTEDSIIIAEEETGTKMTLIFDENEKVKEFYMTAEVDTEEDAQTLKNIYSSEEFSTQCTARVEGKTVIIEYNEQYINTMFEGETRETIEASLVAIEE